MTDADRSAEPAPRALVVTSVGAPGAVVTPVLAALEAVGLEVRAVDVGRVGSRSSATAWRVVRAVMGEFAERRLLHELGEHPPDVALAFDPGSAAALAVARDESATGAPVVAVVPELEPDAAWAEAHADRYLAIDDEAAVSLADHGVEGERVIPVGPIGEHAFAEAGAAPRSRAREQFKLGAGPIVLAEVGDLGPETASQMALQLSLASGAPLFLFDAGDDPGVARALRTQVPTLEMRAKLFGATRDRPSLWRGADVVIARPTPRAVARVLALGARLVAFSPDGDDERAAVRALEERGLGAAASNPLMLSSALEPMLAAGARSDDRVGADGAATVADVARVVAREREAVAGEMRGRRRAEESARVNAATESASWQARRERAAGDLEDLGGVGGTTTSAGGANRGEIDELLRKNRERMESGKKRMVRAREAADASQARAERARAAGREDEAREAQAGADRERRSMHEALAELAELETEATRLKKAREHASAGGRRSAAGAGTGAGARSAGSGRSRGAGRGGGSSVDELLERLKREQAAGRGREPSGTGSGGTVDDELEALKRRMKDRGGRKGT